MLRERVFPNIYVFTSDLYVQTTAGVIVTPEGSVVLDTMPFPVEAAGIKQFVTQELLSNPRYVILTHYHADHTYGAYQFPQSQVVAHARCAQLLATRGEEGLQEVRTEAPELEDVVLRMPDLTLEEGEMDLHLGGTTLRLMWTPGHSDDVISVYVEEARVLFASDTVMPVPIIADGDLDTLKQSLQKLLELEAEIVVQGHGEVILRGEVAEVIQTNITYLDTIQDLVANVIAKGQDRETLMENDIETSCGLSRVSLSGQAPSLHVANLLTLYDRMQKNAR